MKLFLLPSVLLFIVASSSSIEDHWFDQKLDHNDLSNGTTWKQRYFVYDYHFETGSPVFLYISGAEKASEDLMFTCKRFLRDMNHLCFVLEHRFYGKSHPTANLSADNLKSLTTEQALGDIAFFIEGMNRQYNLTRGVNKWVTFGNFYAGSLSAWMRLKYPHLVHAAVAISAPLQLVPEFGYFKTVHKVFESQSEGCWDTISTAFNEFATLLTTQPQEINESFKPCGAVANASKLDVGNLFSVLAIRNFGKIIQSNQWSVGIENVCDVMTNTSLGSPLKRFAEVTRRLQRTDVYGLEYRYQKWIELFRNEHWESSTSSGGRQWLYHTCTELGMFESSTFENQTFGDHFSLDFFMQYCSDIFGPSISKERLLSGISLANLKYGGLDIEVRRVVFVHGSIDPWHALGITQSNDSEAPAILIDGISDCTYVLEERGEYSYPEELQAAKRSISDHLTKWLQPSPQ